MGNSELVPVTVAAQVLGMDYADLRGAVMTRFRSDEIVRSLSKLFELGFVPADTFLALLRDAVREGAER